jgi:pyruvate/2-oxoglutarate dehydrogenase complex dihydrolipoamide dehydrogenase (E3) component
MKLNVSLATNAVKTGIVAAHNIADENTLIKLEGIVGTNGINVFHNQLVSTGLSEEAAKDLKIEVITSIFEDNDRPEFMEDHGKERVKCKMVFNKETRKLIGAQIG